MRGRVLITGAHGRLGSALRVGLRGRLDELHIADIEPLTAEHEREFVHQGDLADLAVAKRVVRGVDAVVHLAGIPDEAPFEHLLNANVRTTYSVLESARLNGVRRVILASSAHVVGFYRRDELIDGSAPYRPDTLYGTTKVFAEALGRLYVDKHGLEVVCLRIGSFRDKPRSRRQLSTWLSPRDAVELVHACLQTEHVGFAVVYGVSANKRKFWVNADGALPEFYPQDDAEEFAAEVHDDEGPDGADEKSRTLQGGVFTSTGYQGGYG